MPGALDGNPVRLLRQLELGMQNTAGVDQWTETDVVGTGASDLTGMAWSLSTGATANSTVARKTGGETAITRGNRFDKIDFSKPITIWCRFCIQGATSTGVSMFSIGKDNNDAPGNFDKRAIAIFRVVNLVLAGAVHDGSGITGVTLDRTLTLNQVYDIRVESDGQGKVTYFLGNELLGSTTAGPSSESATADDSNWQMEVTNGANSAAQGLVIFGCWWESE